jgi:CRISPR system Cascade subunit CasE
VTTAAITELWYSLLHLDLRNSHARDALTDTQAMHKLVQQGFDQERQAHNILYHYLPARPGFAHQILVQATTRPGWGPINGTLLTVDVKEITNQWLSLRTGASYRFRLNANPTTTDSTGRRRAIPDPPNQTLWLTRRLAGAADVKQVSVTAPVTRTGNREEATVTHRAVTYSGVLTVGDADQFRHLIATGIGPGKAYGHGLLTIAPSITT